MSIRVKQVISQIFSYGTLTGRCDDDLVYALRGFIISPEPEHFVSLTNTADVTRLLRLIGAYSRVMVFRAVRRWIMPGK
ncbi:MAG: hypothetical protein LBS75_10000 [Synergistaceae bacterium]|nr:hypothetical protein [Synergistaceae bacterium]